MIPILIAPITIMVAVVSRHRMFADDGPGKAEWINRLVTPPGVRIEYRNLNSGRLDTARNGAISAAKRERVDYLWIVDGGVIPPPDALIRLLAVLGEHQGKAAIGAVYRPTTLGGQAAAFQVFSGISVPIALDGSVQPVDEIGGGCLLIRVADLNGTTPPWFTNERGRATSVHFSRVARRAGVTLLCDTSVECGAIGRPTTPNAIERAAHA